MNTTKLLSLLVLLSGLLGCTPTVVPAPPGPPPADADPSACSDACTIIRLKCPKTEMPQRQDCVSSCVQVESSGYVTMHAPCIARSATADEIRKCNFDCKE